MSYRGVWPTGGRNSHDRRYHGGHGVRNTGQGHPVNQGGFRSAAASSHTDFTSNHTTQQPANYHPSLAYLQVPPFLPFPAIQRPALASPNYRQLRSTFTQQDKKFYCIGRVFRVALHERAGDVKNPKDSKYLLPDIWRRDAISKPRLGIVVERHKGYCIIVGITSYSQKGTEKHFVDVAEHAVARTDSDKTPPSETEFQNAKQMLQDPICIDSDEPGQDNYTLHSGSFVDFGKLYTVHHYHEVEPFGLVSEQSIGALMRHYSFVRGKGQGAKKLGAKEAGESAVFNRGRILPALTPDDPAHIHKYISNSPGKFEERDESYCQQSPEFFAWGTVFRLLSWDEEPMDNQSEITEVVAAESSRGVPILRKVLWLIVIQEGPESCKCLRITTYDGRGVSDLPIGLRPEDHSIVHTGPNAPELSKNETAANVSASSMGLPVRIQQSNREEKLFPTARIVWTRVYEVNLDVKAKEFGHIASGHRHVLEHQFKQLNPLSPVNTKRPRRPTSIAMAETNDLASLSKAGVAVSDQLKLHIPDDSTSTYRESPGENDEESSDSSHSPADSPISQVPGRIYEPGDTVWLMTEKDGPSPFTHFRIYCIAWIRLKPNDDGDYVWQYSLVTERGGQFSGGKYFDQDLLMPA